MCSRRKISFLGVWVLLTITCIKAFPGDRQARQDDDDDDSRASTLSPINFGAQVAQIITGAFTGNIDSIIKGSFGFIEDPNVNKLSHNTWETLKGNPTQTPPWATTTEGQESTRTEVPPKAAAAPPPPPPPPPAAAAQQPAPTPAQVSSLSAAPPLTPEVQQAPSGSEFNALPASPSNFYNPSSPSRYRTRAPGRTTQPTYATLAPLSVIEGTGATEDDSAEEATTRSSEEPSTTTSTDTEDVDEAESLSGEVSEGTTKAPVKKEANFNTAVESTTVVIEGNGEPTTEDDEEQELERQNFFPNY